MEERETIIEVENLVKKFGSFVANDNLSFKVYRGEVFGFLGANGAGKTTAIRILSGLLEPTSGKINVAGFNAYNQRDLIKANIGYMSQKFSLYEDLTVKENIRFFGGIYGLNRKVLKSRIDELLIDLKMEEFKDSLISSLPLGWKQRLAFSIAMIHKPVIVFLDEPTGGVDPITRRGFWEMIHSVANQGTTVFVTTHYMDEAEYCDRVTIMVDGRIEALDSPSSMKKSFNANSMDEVFVMLARKAKTIA